MECCIGFFFVMCVLAGLSGLMDGFRRASGSFHKPASSKHIAEQAREAAFIDALLDDLD